MLHLSKNTFFNTQIWILKQKPQNFQNRKENQMTYISYDYPAQKRFDVIKKISNF